MTLNPFHLVIPHRIVAALLLTAGVLLTSGRTNAGCGDYVTIAGQPARQMGHDGTTPQHLHPDGPARPPCQGPSCDGHPQNREVPLTAPVTIPNAAKDLSDHLHSNPSDDRNDTFPPTTSEGRPINSPLAIYHPPRSS